MLIMNVSSLLPAFTITGILPDKDLSSFVSHFFVVSLKLRFTVLCFISINAVDGLGLIINELYQ